MCQGGSELDSTASPTTSTSVAGVGGLERAAERQRDGARAHLGAPAASYDTWEFAGSAAPALVQLETQPAHEATTNGATR